MNSRILGLNKDYLQLKVSQILWGKASQKVYEYMKNNPEEHYYRDVAAKLGLRADTTRRVLNRLAKKKLISRVFAPTITYDDAGLPVKGPEKPLKGHFQYLDPNLVVESVPNFSRFDMDVLKVHRVDLWGRVEGAWDGLRDPRFKAQWYELEWKPAGNVSRYDARSKVFNAYLQIFRNSAHYQLLRESVPIRFAGQFVRDFDVSLRLLCGRGPEDVRLKCELGFDFYAPDLQDVWENSAELKIYNHPVLRRPYARTEIYLREFNPSLDPESIYSLMLRNLEPYRRLDNVLRTSLGVPRMIDPRDLRPKLRLRE